MKIKQRYKFNKSSNIGDTCTCPSCNTEFIKEHYQQVFCKTKKGTKCKDKHWNTVISSKRNNITRISPASERWMNQHKKYSNFVYNEHPFSSEGLGQWND